MLFVNLHCQLVLRISGNTNMLHNNTSQCKILIVPEDGSFGQPKYSAPSRKLFQNILLCVGFCLMFFISLVKRMRSLLLAQTFFYIIRAILAYLQRRALKLGRLMAKTLNKATSSS